MLQAGSPIPSRGDTIASCEDENMVLGVYRSAYFVARNNIVTHVFTGNAETAYQQAENAYNAACTSSDREAEKRAYDFEVMR